MKYRLTNFAKYCLILICIASSFFIIAYKEGFDSALKLLIEIEYDNYRAVTIHDMFEDENINLENRVNQLFDYQELKEFIDSVEVKKSHNTD